MNTTPPLVTIMIATRDRTTDLRETLRQLRTQDYSSVELMVIDDGSREPVAPMVQELWPGARVVRHETCAGQCVRRNEGFALAAGDYILHLDDDCALVGPDALCRAVGIMQDRTQGAALVPFLFNGPTLPSELTPSRTPGCVASFVGACVLLRTESIRHTSGYPGFFGNEFEEEDLALQILKLGSYLWFEPSIVAHHRISPVNRNQPRTWRRGLRNRLWSIIMHMPASALPLELGWKAGVGAWDALRLCRPHHYMQALSEFFLGLPRALRLRRPMSSLDCRRYRALRFRGVLPLPEFQAPQPFRWTDLKEWSARWRERARNRSVWDRDPGDTGVSPNVGYAHQKWGERSDLR